MIAPLGSATSMERCRRLGGVLLLGKPGSWGRECRALCDDDIKSVAMNCNSTIHSLVKVLTWTSMIHRLLEIRVAEVRTPLVYLTPTGNGVSAPLTNERPSRRSQIADIVLRRVFRAIASVCRGNRPAVGREEYATRLCSINFCVYYNIALFSVQHTRQIAWRCGVQTPSLSKCS